MSAGTDTRDVTDSLKAFAILSVCANHFLNGFVTESLNGYANGFIAIFFVLSGYGTCLSLQAKAGAGVGPALWPFFRKRLTRIYPLFWIWCAVNGFANGLLGFFALDFIRPRSPWFVPAIVQCYLAAPLLLLLWRGASRWRALAVALAAFAAINGVLFAAGVEPIRMIGYRDLFFSHILLFFLGFLLAERRPRPLPSAAPWAGLALFLLAVQETTPRPFLSFPGREVAMPILFVAATTFFCFAALQAPLRLPFPRALRFVGQHTYSIYLFHGFSFSVLERLGVLRPLATPAIGILCWIATFPIFIVLCAALEMTVNEFVFGERRAANVLARLRESLRPAGPARVAP